MGIDQDDLDAEIAGHLALSIKERVDRGEDPVAARRAAIKEFGNVTLTRDSMQRVWRPTWVDNLAALGRDLKFALRALGRAKGMMATIVVTLALGIGANAAIFSVVRGVLLRPLVNRDEDRLIYVRQSGPGIGADNMTFSVPEINDFKNRSRTVASFGDFSTVDFTLIGFGKEPRAIKAGVVSGTFFDVMGLRPILGRLLTPKDDGPNAESVVVLTHRFWSTSLGSDPHVLGQQIRLGTKVATVVGVLEPSVPYPADTELIANVVTSPHHMGAFMVTGRTHRMTELFGRLAPGATVESARAEMVALHGSMMQEHPEAYSKRANMQVSVSRLRDQIAAPARTILLGLLAAAAVVFVIACSNVANLILARSVKREGELAVRAALGAGRGALRRTLLAESLVLCTAGAALGMLLAGPLVNMVVRYAARFSVRATEVTLDGSVLLVGASLAILAAVLLAYVPRLPSSRAASGFGLATGGVRITPATNRRLRLFATTQIAFSFVLLAGAAMLITALLAQQRAQTGYDMQHVLAIDVPGPATGAATPNGAGLYRESIRRLAGLPGVTGVAGGMVVPWRDAASQFEFRFSVEGSQMADAEDNPPSRMRMVTPGFFDVVGVRLLAGRDFTDEDRAGKELVTIVNETIAQRFFPNSNALNGRLTLTDPVSGKPGLPRRVVGVVADVDDVQLTPGAATMTVYVPAQQLGGSAPRIFLRANGDPYALVPAVTKTIREVSPDQAVERIATLEDVRAGVLAPDRVNAFVFSGFAGVALLIAGVGVAGVLAFSASARTREFGVRLAVGAAPRHLLTRVLSQGLSIAGLGVTAGAIAAYGLSRIAGSMSEDIRLPGLTPILVASVVLIGAAGVAALMPAARASRLDVVQALRSD